MTRRTYFLFVVFSLPLTIWFTLLFWVSFIFLLAYPLASLQVTVPLFLSGTILFLATVKRLHDTDNSGKAAFLIFLLPILPLAPFLLLMGLWLLMEPYNDLGGVNQYGKNPRKSVEIRETLPPDPPISW